MMTDPLADMLTRIRNANRIERPAVDMPATVLKKNVAQVLKDEGFILDYHVGQLVPDEAGHPAFQPDADLSKPKSVLRVYLKYHGEASVIRELRRVSTPGLRRYVKSREIPRVKNGLGMAILSTPRGLMTDRDARRAHVGGELLAVLW